MAAPRKSPLLPIFTTVFIDLVGVGIVLPVLAPLFLDPTTAIVPLAWSLAKRQIIYGFLAACYPLAQFFGSPYLGAWSDRKGRKPVLLLSLAGTFIGYLFFALAIRWGLVWLLFASRTLDGFTGGNISTAQSAIADVSTEKTKTANFSLIGIAYGIGFILGPYIGGTFASSFGPAAPFWFAAGLAICNIILVALRFDETLFTRLKSRMSLLIGFEDLRKAFRLVNMRAMFLVAFLSTLGFTFFTQFFPVLAIPKYGFTAATIGNMFAYIGVWFVLTQVFIVRPVGRRWRPEQVVGPSLVLWGLTLAALAIPRDAWVLYVITPFMSLAVGLAQPNTTAVISNLADEKSQGEALGINQSVTGLATALPPIIAGFVAAINNYLPIILAAFLVFAAWFAFAFVFNRQRHLRYHEV